MFIRLLSIFLIMSFLVTPVSASETTRVGLKAIYDDYHYSLNVEWDQKDPGFVKAAEAKFKLGLAELQKQGLTNEELTSFVSSQIKSDKVKSDFNNLVMMVKINTLPDSEVNKLVKNIIKDNYQSGASWNGESSEKLFKALYIIFSVLAVAAVITGAVMACGNSSTGCSDGSSSDEGGCYDVCDTYYDEYGEWSDCYTVCD